MYFGSISSNKVKRFQIEPRATLTNDAEHEIIIEETILTDEEFQKRVEELMALPIGIKFA